MKIFIAEYIIFYETFNINVFEEFNMNSMAFDYTNYYSTLHELDNRFMYKNTYYPYEIGNNRFVRKQQVANTFF